MSSRGPGMMPPDVYLASLARKRMAAGVLFLDRAGRDRPVGRVLAVDWVPSRPERPEGLVLVYEGGVLARADVDAITVPQGELAGFAFVPPARVAERVTPLVGRRIAACLEAAASGLVAVLENGSQLSRGPDFDPMLELVTGP